MATPPETELDAIDLLIEQHDEIDQLLKRLEGEPLEGTEKMLVFFELADKLTAHAEVEERILYPAARATQHDGISLESIEEHTAIKRVVAEMLGTDLEDVRFSALLAVLHELVDRHNRGEEEHEVFPTLRESMTGVELARLGREMKVMFDHLLSEQPRNNVHVPAEEEWVEVWFNR
jgi:hypothetical protein